MIALIDADSIVYIVAWKYKEYQDIAVDEVLRNCDEFVHAILKSVNATHYLGSFSDSPTFRHRIYKYAPYKGTRKEKEPWLTFWEPIIKNHFVEKWGFVIPKDIEADDVISAAALTLEGPVTICSPDKDMRQIAGIHFDYRKPSEGTKIVDTQQAELNLWMQVIMGDATDNIKGVPGLGEVKVAGMFKDQEVLFYPTIARTAYAKYFGEYYGEILFEETVNTVKLIGQYHPQWPIYRAQLQMILETYVKEIQTPVESLDGTRLSELGW